MVIIDFNQLVISNVMAQIGNHTNIKIEEDLVRHMVLNKIRVIRQMYKQGVYGNIVVACDGKNNWRRVVFPQYKASRRSARNASDFDWDSIFEILNKIRDELMNNFGYIVIHMDGAEADDIIASLVLEYGVDLNTEDAERIVIVSGDKDFVQLQRFANVQQYDPVKNRVIKESNPIFFVKQHIIKGDKGDGVPNILSSDNCFVEGVRQRKITEKFIREFDYESQPEDVQRNYKRNELLIDLTKVPDDIQQKTLSTYASEQKTILFRKQKMFNYFISYRLKNLMEHVGEF